MLISGKQQEANQQNAQHSTGPKTPEGKAAVRLNALTYGLRACCLLIDGEDPEQYKQLWDALEADWQPENLTERLHLEQMATSQWLLARIARGESRIYEADIPLAEQFALLAQASTQRTRLERSFSNAMRDLKQLQNERQARLRQQPAKTPKNAHPPVQPQTDPPAKPQTSRPDYLMSEETENYQPFAPLPLPILVSNLPT